MMRRFRFPLFLLVLPASGLLVAAAPSPVRLKAASAKPAPAVSGPIAAATPDNFSKEVEPLVQKYCVGCHGGASPTAGISLAPFHDTAAVLKARDIWDKVATNVISGHMPPKGAAAPTAAERSQIVGWIQSTLSKADCKISQPGHVTMRRLNREEYNNTIRDLIGLDLRPAREFPSDDVGYGFDNIGDVLSISPLLMDKYLRAAEKVAEAAIITPEAQQKSGKKEPLPESHRRILFCQPVPGKHDQAARKILAAFARRAYRRPVTKDEVDRLARYVRLAEGHGESFERGIQLAVEAVLVSPNFLFRVETQEEPSEGSDLLGNYEMASRLSYFLWSSMPDEQLFSLAAQGKLQDPVVLAAQAKRMLKDPKAKALADNFASQWLTLRKLDRVNPDPFRFPLFDDNLRDAMRTETEMFFEAVVKEDRRLQDFLDGRFSFMNEDLARLYGIPGVKGNQFRRVWLTGDQRRGILTQASILTVTSNPTRTSPVKRGKWVLEQILGTPPPPQPPDVGKLPDDRRRGRLVGTLRQRMEQHRRDPMCASCHAQMDPIGFGMENFDAIGKWRTLDGGLPIDATGELPGGKKFNGPAELITILKAKQDLFVRCLTEKMLTYALGRGLEPYDHCNVDQTVKNIAHHGYHFSALIAEVVKSDPFRKRSSGNPEGQPPAPAKLPKSAVAKNKIPGTKAITRWRGYPRALRHGGPQKVEPKKVAEVLR